MNKNLIDLIIEELKHQKEIFGDELFTEIKLPDVELLVKNNSIVGARPEHAKNLPDKEEKVREHKEKKGEICCDAKDLTELEKCMHDCHECPLQETRTNLVFGKGDPNADVMIIGEAPGAEEDKKGEPFVGRAGQLLTDILKAINFSREEIYITNIVKCRPPGNRNPSPEEMEICLPYLKEQIKMIKPKVILCLGLVSAAGVLNLRQALGKMRGNVYELGDAKVMVTYHPAALLRNPGWKKDTWEDVQKFRKLYDDIIGNKK